MSKQLIIVNTGSGLDGLPVEVVRRGRKRHLVRLLRGATVAAGAGWFAGNLVVVLVHQVRESE